MALVFAVKEINENSQILPNVTLGFHIYDNYYNSMWTYHSTMLLMYSLERFSPNYNCDLRNKLTAVIGGLDSQISSNMAIFLDMHKIPQVRYANKSMTSLQFLHNSLVIVGSNGCFWRQQMNLILHVSVICGRGVLLFYFVFLLIFIVHFMFCTFLCSEPPLELQMKGGTQI